MNNATLDGRVKIAINMNNNLGASEFARTEGDAEEVLMRSLASNYSVDMCTTHILILSIDPITNSIQHRHRHQRSQPNWFVVAPTQCTFVIHITYRNGFYSNLGQEIASESVDNRPPRSAAQFRRAGSLPAGMGS